MAYDCKDYVSRLLEPYSYSKHWAEEEILSAIKQVPNPASWREIEKDSFADTVYKHIGPSDHY
jgi:hypothetical protein